jgi:hypothetical protein
MQNYSALEVFPQEIQRARELIERAWDLIPDSEGMLRCHELARVAQDLLSHSPNPSLQTVVMDGKYGAVEHSWLMFPWSPETHILDVYCVGRLPQVQLTILACPGTDTLYRPGKPREDIDHVLVKRLACTILLKLEGWEAMRPLQQEWRQAEMEQYRKRSQTASTEEWRVAERAELERERMLQRPRPTGDLPDMESLPNIPGTILIPKPSLFPSPFRPGSCPKCGHPGGAEHYPECQNK